MRKPVTARNSTRRAAILLKTVSIAIGFALVLSLVFAPLGHPQAVRSAPIAERVLLDAAANGEADFLVVLTDQPGQALAQRRFSSATEQGQVVYETLSSSAASSQQALVTQLKQVGIAVQPFWIVNSIAVRGPASLVQSIAQRPEVAYIVSNAPFKVELEQPEPGPVLTGASSGVEWNLDWVKAPQVWATGATGQGIVYANADTGVQWDHPALKDQYRGWNGSTADHDYNWHDAIIDKTITGSTSNPCGYNLQAPCDDDGHGTHTMGIGVGTISDQGTQIGMAPGAKWISCRNMDAGVGRPSTYLDCFQFFMAPTKLNGKSPDPSKRPDVVGNSYSCPTAPPPIGENCIDPRVMQTAAQNLRAAGIFMSVSAGNSGPGCNSINTPPSLEPGFFTVGSSGYQTNTISVFSSRGPVLLNGETWMKPDLVAPGSSIYSSVKNGGYGYKSGTSMAAPMVAGAVALLWSARPDLRSDIARTETALRFSAFHLVASSGSALLCGADLADSVPNNTYGYGELDVLAAVNSHPAFLYLTSISR
jgi:serine protease AprX